MRFSGQGNERGQGMNTQRGGTLLGLVIGALIGLGAALLGLVIFFLLLSGISGA